jgi:hypothetical protein
MNELLVGAIGIVLGFLLSLARDWWQRKRMQSAFWAAMSAESDYCRHLAEKYLEDSIRAPLYRLPTTAHSSALPALLADGALTKSQVAALIEFVAEVDSFNRGLERSASALNEPAELAEFERNKIKAHRLTGSGATFQAVHQIHVVKGYGGA